MSAQILPFTAAPRGKTQPRKGGSDTLPVIVILPCVRYERWDDPAPLDEAPNRLGAQASSAHH